MTLNGVINGRYIALSHLPYAICSSCTLCCMCSWQITDDDTLASTWSVSIGSRRGSSVICVASHARTISVCYWSASVSKPSIRWLNLICVFITISDQSISRCVYRYPAFFVATCGCASNTRSSCFLTTCDRLFIFTAVMWRIWLRSSFSFVCLLRF